MRKTLLAAAAIVLAAGGPALAQDLAGGPGEAGSANLDMDRSTVTVGVTGVYLPDYDGSDDYRLIPAPTAIGTVGGFSFQLIGNRASVDLIPDPKGPSVDLEAGPIGVVNLNRSRTGSIDDPRVKALGKVGTAIELGGYVGIGKTGVLTSPYDKLSVSVSYRHDVNDVHDSGIWQPSVNYITPLSRKVAVGFFASAQHVGRRYAAAYYSVSPAGGVASGLPVYSAGEGWKDYSVGGVGTFSLTGDLLQGFKLLVGGSYSRELNSIGRSPIVSIAGRRSQWLGTAGLAYTF